MIRRIDNMRLTDNSTDAHQQKNNTKNINHITRFWWLYIILFYISRDITFYYSCYPLFYSNSTFLELIFVELRQEGKENSFTVLVYMYTNSN